MNLVDYMVEEKQIKSVMAVHFPGDYGGDGAAGAEIAAEQNDLEFTAVETAPGQEAQAGAISAIVSQKPDLVMLGTSPTETAVIVGQAAAQGYTGQFIGLGPTWNPALLAHPGRSRTGGALPAVGLLGAVRHRHPGTPGDAGRAG